MCEYDKCEFYNVILGGIVTGIIASLFIMLFTFLIETFCFWIKYRHLKSSNNNFDWLSYSMKEDNGRIKDKLTGAVASISLSSRRKKIKIKLKHDDREWEGELEMGKFGFGLLSLKYKNEHEYCKRECIIGSYIEDSKTFDYLFFEPIKYKIAILKQEGEGLVPEYVYGSELLLRPRTQ